MTDQVLMEIYDVMQDAWKFAKKHRDTEKTDDAAWGNAVEEFDKLIKKHNNSDFAISILSATALAIDRNSIGKNI